MKYVYGIVGLAAAITAIVVGVLGMTAVMIVSGLLAGLLITIANADRIVRVKAGTGGLEAETRALVDKAVATLDQLRAVLKIAVRGNLSLVQRAGRWGGFSVDEKERIRKGSLAALELLDVPKHEREEMFREWNMVNRFDYAHIVLGGHKIPDEIVSNQALQKEWSAMRDGGFERFPTSAQVDDFLRRAGMLTSERAELLEDYRHYEKTGEHRRPEVWKAMHGRDR